MKIYLVAETREVAREMKNSQIAWRNALGVPVPEYIEVSHFSNIRGLVINPDHVILSSSFHRSTNPEKAMEILSQLNLAVHAWEVTRG